MDYGFVPFLNYMLTRKCSCGGDPEMLVDFVDGHIVRCSKCHLSTHAYMDPKIAAAHWNSGDDIMPRPLHIFWDNPKGYLQGEVVAIHIAEDGFKPVTQQSIDFLEAIIEYTDKRIYVELDDHGDYAILDFGLITEFSSDRYPYTIKPDAGESIRFENLVFCGDSVSRLDLRWDTSCLSIVASHKSLVITRDIVSYNEVSSSMDGDYPLDPIKN